MLADAERNARQLRGEGDAIAAQIYADAYSKNADFYSFALTANKMSWLLHQIATSSSIWTSQTVTK